MKSSGIAVLIFVCLSIVGGGCIVVISGGGANERFERTVDLVYESMNLPHFHTKTTNGSITLHGEDTDQCRVHAISLYNSVSPGNADRVLYAF